MRGRFLGNDYESLILKFNPVLVNVPINFNTSQHDTVQANYLSISMR